MRVIIVRPDNIVSVDGEPRPIDCSSVDPAIRVIQWMETFGWLEFDNSQALVAKSGGAAFMLNQEISSIEPWQYLIDAWNAWTPPPPPSDLESES